MIARFFIIFCFTACMTRGVNAQTLEDVIQRMSSFEKGSAEWDAKKYLEASDEAFQRWEKASDEEKKKSVYPQMFLVHFRRAEIFAELGDFVKAATELTKEGKLQKEYGGRLEFATKSPNAFFRRLAELQASVAASTGTDPLAGIVDYLFLSEGGNKFIVARQEIDNEIEGITIEGIKPTEALTQMLQLSVRDGHAVVEKTRWLVGPKDNAENMVRRATKEVLRNANERLLLVPVKD